MVGSSTSNGPGAAGAATLVSELNGVVKAIPEGPRLALVAYPGSGAEMALLTPGQPLVVGRGSPSELILSEPKLSRTHARFVLLNDRVTVEDLGSTNGTWIGGERVQTGELGADAEVILGETLVRICRLGPALGPAPDPGVAEAQPQRFAEVGDGAAGMEDPGDGIVAGPAMSELLETTARVAASSIPVILRGETGAGKEVIARLLHEGGRRKGRMVRVNCGAIPAQLVESTLFGHERGAFTGAIQQQRGVFEEADGGTVFLDEIGELPLPAQAALLRVLETGAFSRVGSTREVTVDVRVITATHRDLEAMADDGSFRADLYYRLNGITLEIPPLRERREDIGPLVARFLREANRNNGRSVRGIAPEALALLERYRWPGNVRELKNAIEHAVVVARSDLLGEKDLPTRVRGASKPPGVGSLKEPARGDPRADKSEPIPVFGRGDGGAQLPPGADVTRPPEQPPAPEGELRTRVQQYEAQIIVEALKAAGGKRAEAARLLGMPLRTLTHKIKVLGIKPGER